MSIPIEAVKTIAKGANQYAQNIAIKYGFPYEIHTDVTDHLIERAEQRNISHSLVARILARTFSTHLCELLYCMETKDLTYLNWKSNLRDIVIPCRTFKRDDGSYSIVFTSIFEGKCKLRDEHHNIQMRA